MEQGSSFRRGPNDKLLPFLAGPYEVIEAKGSEYILKNCITEKTKIIHLSKLTKYIVDQDQRSPAEAALRDYGDVFMVERIVEGARGNDLKGPVSQLHFKVAWVGFPGKDTIEPWKEVRKLECFKRFLEEHSVKGYRELARKLPSREEGHESEAAKEGKVQEEPTSLSMGEESRDKKQKGDVETSLKANQWEVRVRESMRESRKPTRLIEEK